MENCAARIDCGKRYEPGCAQHGRPGRVGGSWLVGGYRTFEQGCVLRAGGTLERADDTGTQETAGVTLLLSGFESGVFCVKGFTKVGAGLLGQDIEDGHEQIRVAAPAEEFDGELAAPGGLGPQCAKTVEGAAGIELGGTAGCRHGWMVQDGAGKGVVNSVESWSCARIAAPVAMEHGAGMSFEGDPGRAGGLPGERLIDLSSYVRGLPAQLRPCRYDFAVPPEGTSMVGAGGDFEPETIVGAYRAGAFPWPHDGVDHLWFSPTPRAILPLDGLHISRRLRRTLRSARFRVTIDAAFSQVILRCAVREEGTWITPAIITAYCRLHELGWAHSFEVWTGDGTLAGGLYGVAVGAMFGAESMFHSVTDASKVAMVALMEHAALIGLELVDVQVLTEHTQRMGAIEISRAEYLRRLNVALSHQAKWWQGKRLPDEC